VSSDDQRERAVLAAKAHIRIAVEEPLAVRGGTVLQIDAALQIEDRLQPAAKILRTAQTPAAIGDRAVRHEQAAIVFGVGVRQIANAHVSDAVQRDRTLCRGLLGGHREGGATHDGGGLEESYLSHWHSCLCGYGFFIQVRRAQADYAPARR
jgi:hypothetical protein